MTKQRSKVRAPATCSAADRSTADTDRSFGAGLYALKTAGAQRRPERGDSPALGIEGVRLPDAEALVQLEYRRRADPQTAAAAPGIHGVTAEGIIDPYFCPPSLEAHGAASVFRFPHRSIAALERRNFIPRCQGYRLAGAHVAADPAAEAALRIDANAAVPRQELDCAELA